MYPWSPFPESLSSFFLLFLFLMTTIGPQSVAMAPQMTTMTGGFAGQTVRGGQSIVGSQQLVGGQQFSPQTTTFAGVFGGGVYGTQVLR